MLLNDDGSFYEKRKPLVNQDYGAAISLTFKLKPKATIKIPFAIALDFPQQRFIDGKTFERKYVKSFRNEETRVVDMVKIALDNYPEWLNRTLKIQSGIFDSYPEKSFLQERPAGALRLTRLILNEFSFPLSNAAVWIEDKNGNDVARFLECFDYAYLDPSDVEWYSMVMLVLFPKVERNLCQGFIDSILAEDLTPRFYHIHASFVEARKHFREHPEEYEGRPLTQIHGAFQNQGQRRARFVRLAERPCPAQCQRLCVVQQQLLGGPFPQTGLTGVAQRQIHRRHGFPEEELGDAQIRLRVCADTRY